MYLKLLNPDPKSMKVGYNGHFVVVPANGEAIVPHSVGVGIQIQCATLEVVSATEKEAKAFEEKVLNERREAKMKVDAVKKAEKEAEKELANKKAEKLADEKSKKVGLDKAKKSKKKKV